MPSKNLTPISFLDVGATARELKSELDVAYQRVMLSGRVLLGNELESFEREFAAYCGTRHCVGVGSGLDALYLTLRAWDIGAGDEVLVPSNTYIATWLAVTHTGARPVPVEPDPQTHTIDPALIEAAITPRTRAIIPVHLYGRPAEMDPILAVARRHGLKILEDAAQAHGARYHGRPAGALGDAGAFSFYPGKNLGAFGDGGAIMTDDDAVADRLRMLRNYGSPRKYEHLLLGYNSRLDELQAAFLRVKLRKLDEWNHRRSAIANWYQTTLPRIFPELEQPASSSSSASSWHLYVVKSPNRDALRNKLTAAGIETIIHYPTPPHLQDAYRELGYGLGSFPIAEQLAREVLSLPIGPHLTIAALERSALGRNF